jgi:hypothetical protein
MAVRRITGDRPAQRGRRARRSAALVATVPFLAVLGVQAQGASAAPAERPVSVVTQGLNNPRHLHFLDGKLYVAEAGTGGNGPCATGPEGQACVGRSGDVAVVGVAGGVTRIMKGVSSVAAPDGSGAGGLADVAFVGSNPVGIVQDTNINSNGANPFGPMGNDLGKLVVGLRGGAGPLLPGPDLARYEAQHNPDHGRPTSGPDAEDPAIDSDPYALTPYQGGFAVADAAGNDVLFVNSHGVISTLAVLPTNTVAVPGAPAGTTAQIQAIPTSVRVGPDGALYVSELSGIGGSAKVLRVTPGHTTVYASGFDSISDIAFDSRGRLLVLELQQGGLFGPPAPGALIQFDKATGARRTLTTALSQPTGVAVNGNRVFISNNGSSAAGGSSGGEVVTLVQNG